MQILEQRHLFLNHLKTLSVGLARNQNQATVDWHLTNQVAVSLLLILLLLLETLSCNFYYKTTITISNPATIIAKAFLQLLKLSFYESILLPLLLSRRIWIRESRTQTNVHVLFSRSKCHRRNMHF